jgi:hypothetical protein
MQFGSSLDSFPCFTRLNPCVAHCSTDLIPWVHHSREEGSLDYDGGFVRLQIHMNFDTIIYCQQAPFSGAVAGEQAIKIRSSIAYFSVFLLISFASLKFDHPQKEKNQSNLVLINPNFSIFRLLFYC